MLKKQFFNNILFFIVALITLIATTLAWFNLSKVGEVDGIQSNIDSLGKLELYVQKNGIGEFQLIKMHNEMLGLFDLTEPGDYYTFKVQYTNDTSRARTLSGFIYGVQTDYNLTKDPDQLYDLLNVFYLSNLAVTNDGVLQTGDNFELTPSDLNDLTEPVEVLGQVLNLYRLNNLKDLNNNVNLFNGLTVQPGKIAVVTFDVVFDVNTENIGYQYNGSYFDSLYIYGT